ncbi:MAG: hypothetical protein IMY82_10265 [Chloroflexi bacterium]|nr:hypothetical protein [Chloroflexota bacterium]
MKAKKSRKRLNQEGRLHNARKWLSQNYPKNLVQAYCKRYGVSEAQAQWDLLELGYRDDVRIQAYESEGVEWEYQVDGYSGEMKVVPKGTPEWELYLL